jgi:dihydroorotase
MTLGSMGDAWLPTLVERLTAGPYAVLGRASGLREPRLVVGHPADCVLFDPDEAWEVGAEPFLSRSRNTPLLGVTLRGRVLLTLRQGRVAFVSRSTLYALNSAEVIRA